MTLEQAMTLEQVMALSDRELNQAVAMKVSPVKCVQEWLYFEPAESDGVIYNGPDFSRSWSAAMQIRDWARGLDATQRFLWFNHVTACMDARIGDGTKPLVLIGMEPIDFARAALLVSE